MEPQAPPRRRPVGTDLEPAELPSSESTSGASGGRPPLTTNPAPVLYGVVVYAAGAIRDVVETLISFSSPDAAHTFARERGWDDYAVTPLRFFADRRLSPPAGSRLYLDGVLARRGCGQ